MSDEARDAVREAIFAWGEAGSARAGDLFLEVERALDAFATASARAPSAEETRLRAEVDSLRATLGQQPAAEGAEPIGCPLPGACGAVRAHAAAFAAGAAEMRERIIGKCDRDHDTWSKAIETAVANKDFGVALDCEGRRAAVALLSISIRALPLPAGGSGWRPIETAPIDQEIDVWVARSEDGHAYSHGYRQERVVWNATDQYWEGERTAILPRQATHWQPLPAAPEEGDE